MLQMLANLKSLFMADMGPLPLTLLTSFGQLRSLNLSGNHLVNLSLPILNPANNLEVSICFHFFGRLKMNIQKNVNGSFFNLTL